MQEVYPLIASKAKQEDGVIYWADETAVVQDGHWVRGSAPAGDAPVLAATSQRFGLTMISAISCKGLVRFEFLEGAATTETTIGFMQRFIQDSEGHKVFLILDNLKAHHTQEVAIWVQAHERESRCSTCRPTRRRATRMNTSTGTSRPSCAAPIAAQHQADCWRRPPPSCSSSSAARSG